MGDYWKTVKANKVTSTGYIMITAGLAAMVLGERETFDFSTMLYFHGALITAVGFQALFSTLFGVQTLQSYKRAQKHIEKNGAIDDRFASKHKWYCDKVGIRLAAQEAGIDYKL